MAIYGYCRISTKKQNIERQIRNIKAAYPEAEIFQEAYTGKQIIRAQFDRMLRRVKPGDTIVFDSVSRMSRNAEDGEKLYFALFDQGIDLIFLKEHYIDTTVYRENLKDKIALQGTDEDEIFKGLNNYFRKLARRQIRIAFEQAQKEVDDLSQRTKEGIKTARLHGKKVGGPAHKSRTLHIKKKEPIKAEIRRKSKEFDGMMTDVDLIKVLGIARNTYYKYKKELCEERIAAATAEM